ncbi:MAG: GNAT family N-acetyltransferase [Chitinophagaceae bacterium]|nr:GNAT family N-acetyltransferase [Chitinophagaceae bacterium]
MKFILETPRLLLRELSQDDYQNFFDLNNDPEVVKYVGDGAFASVNAAKNFLLNYDQYKKYGVGRWAVILKASNEFTGWCGLKFQQDLSETGEVDLGYRFSRKFWGQGIGSEAAKACVDYGFHQLHYKRIIGRVMAGNIASVKVLEHCGMHFVREMKFDEHPGLWFEIENPDWKEPSYSPINCNFYDELEALATSKKNIEILYRNEIGVRIISTGIIKTFFIENKAEFMQLENNLVIRLDKLISVNGKILPSIANN